VKPPLTIASLITAEKLREELTYGTLQLTQQWTKMIATDGTTVTSLLSTLTSSGSDARTAENSMVEETSPSSSTATDGLSDSHSGRKNSIIISVGVVSAAAFLGILIFILAQRQRKRRNSRRTQLMRHQGPRQYDPNCSYFSLDSTLDS
jgi:ABC-type Fe3+ transport system permease subunit